jgi:hypothetical protein
MRKQKLTTAVVQKTGSQPTKSLGNHKKKAKNVRRLLFGSMISNTHIKSHVLELLISARLGIQSVTRPTMKKALKRSRSPRGREWSYSTHNK